MSNMVPSQLSFSEIEKSAPSGTVSAIKRWYQSVQSAGGVAQRAKIHAAAAGNTVRQTGESVVIGAALGAFSSRFGGLDYDVQGDGKMMVPVDAAAGALALLGGVALAHEEYGKDLTNTGAAAMAIFAYRKTEQYLAKKEGWAQKSPKFHGDYEFGNEDPIAAAGRLL